MIEPLPARLLRRLGEETLLAVSERRAVLVALAWLEAKKGALASALSCSPGRGRWRGVKRTHSGCGGPRGGRGRGRC